MCRCGLDKFSLARYGLRKRRDVANLMGSFSRWQATHIITATFWAGQIGRHQGTAHLDAVTNRTGDKPRFILRIKSSTSLEPAFKFMCQIADQLIFDHLSRLTEIYLSYR